MTELSHLRVAIVGAGLMGRWHAHFARKAGASIAAVVDKKTSAAEDLARKFHAESFDDFTECLRQSEIDIVHICTPLSSHFVIARAALESGRHVLVEKPAAATASEIQELIGLAKREGLKFNPVHQFPFQRGFRKLIRNLDRLGEPVRIAYNVCSAGGAGLSEADRCALLLEILTHPLAVFCSLFGAEALQASWRVNTFTTDELEMNGKFREAILSIFISLGGRPTRNQLMLVGKSATAHLDLSHGFCLFEGSDLSRTSKLMQPFKYGGKLLFIAAANLIERVARSERAYPGLGELIRQFYRSVQRGVAPPVTDEEMIEIASQIDQLRTNYCS